MDEKNKDQNNKENSAPPTPGMNNASGKTAPEAIVIQPNISIDTNNSSATATATATENPDTLQESSEVMTVAQIDKKRTERPIKIILIIIVAIFTIFISAAAIVTGVWFVSCGSKINRMNKQANEKAEFVSTMDIQNFNLVKINKYLDGDCLTGSAGHVSSQLTGGPVVGLTIEENIDRVMSNRGYAKQGEYYAVPHYNSEKQRMEVSWIGTHYSKGDDRYAVNYYLQDYFVCPDGKKCPESYQLDYGATLRNNKYMLDKLLDREFKLISIDNR